MRNLQLNNGEEKNVSPLISILVPQIQEKLHIEELRSLVN